MTTSRSWGLVDVAGLTYREATEAIDVPTPSEPTLASASAETRRR